jgi:hypothetical protein
MSTVNGATIFGAFEQTSFPSLGVDSVLAKIDTGAFSGAIHCSSIKVQKRADGQKVLRFTPLNNTREIAMDHYQVITVRSSTGHEVERYLIDTEIDIKGKTYPIRIGLSDRSNMQREVLIGRRFLRENGILVDTRINQEYDTDGTGEKYENSDSF